MAVRSQPGCSADWQPEQSLALLPLHHVTGHRLQCMSAAIGPTAVHIGTDTVGSIRASACASKCPKLILRPFHPLRLLGDICRYRFASSPIRSFAADRHLCHFANNNDTTTLAAVANALVSSLRVAGVSPLSVTVWARHCLTRAVHGHPPHTFHSTIRCKSRRSARQLPARLNVDYGKADHGMAGLDCRSTD